MANLQVVFVVICFVAGAIQINGDDIDYKIIGRLLTPQEGCGTSGGRSRRVKRVVGGSYASNDAWPWAVLLGLKRNGQFMGFICAGSLITSRHVLSAAHCMNSDLNFARLGEYDIRTKVDGEHIDVGIARWDQHNGWNPDLMINDIAMISLAQDVIFNERVKPVCLPITPELINQRFTGYNPFVIGWGNTAEGGQQSPILKQVQVPIINNNQCREIFRSIGMLKSDVQFSDGVICAGFTQGQSTCHGDAGGPLQLPLSAQVVNYYAYYQIGVVSWGIGCGRANTPTVYTNVQHYADWIKSKLS